eukprot:XP_001701304.1 predicted protein [Chlamydomonas reinhardtii]
MPAINVWQLIKSGLVNAVLAEAQEAARAILAGFVGQPDEVVEQLVCCLDSPALALMQWGAEFAVVRGRMPGALAAALEAAVAPHAADISHQGLALKSQLVLGLMARLVLPAPAQYRPLLRRLAALGGGGGGKGLGELSARAAQLLTPSLFVPHPPFT